MEGCRGGYILLNDTVLIFFNLYEPNDYVNSHNTLNLVTI